MATENDGVVGEAYEVLDAEGDSMGDGQETVEAGFSPERRRVLGMLGAAALGGALHRFTGGALSVLAEAEAGDIELLKDWRTHEHMGIPVRSFMDLKPRGVLALLQQEGLDVKRNFRAFRSLASRARATRSQEKADSSARRAKESFKRGDRYAREGDQYAREGDQYAREGDQLFEEGNRLLEEGNRLLREGMNRTY